MSKFKWSTYHQSPPPRSKSIALVMAGGRGSRMKSSVPKSLHQIGGVSFLEHILQSLNELPLVGVCVVLWEANYQLFLPVLARFKHHEAKHPLAVCLQQDPGGTAYAVGCLSALWPQSLPAPSYCQSRLLWGFDCRPELSFALVESVLICPGDTPALCAKTLMRLVDNHAAQGSALSLIGCYFDNPFGYGRMICNEQGKLQRIVEQKDATPAEQMIKLCYSGVMMAQLRPLFGWLAQVLPNVITGEYYLTDVIGMACQASKNPKDAAAEIDFLVAESATAFLGVNSQQQRSVVEDLMRR